EAALRALLDALFDRGDEVARDGAAEDLVDELEASAAFERLHADLAVAELAVAAGLLLVPSLHVGPAQDGLPVGHARSAQLDLDVVALLEPGDGDLDVLLAGAAQQELAGGGVTVKV